MMIEQFLRDAVFSENWSGKSDLVRHYEDSLAAFFGTRHAVSVNSGSAAIQVALAAVGAGPGKNVAVSMAAPLPSLLPIIASGARPLFVNCSLRHPGIDPKSLRAKVDQDTVAVLEVPLWGYPQRLDGVHEVASSIGGIPIIEDAAQAHGSSVDGQFVGSRATISCFSSHHKKLLSTGEGGFVLTDDEKIAARLKRLSRLGDLDGANFGWNFKISAFTAAVGLAGLRGLPDRVCERRNAAETLLARLSTAGFREIEHIGIPNGYNLVGYFQDTDLNFKFKANMADEGLVPDCRKYGYKPANRHQLFAYDKTDGSRAEKLISDLIQFPTVDATDTLMRIDRIIASIR